MKPIKLKELDPESLIYLRGELVWFVEIRGSDMNSMSIVLYHTVREILYTKMMDGNYQYKTLKLMPSGVAAVMFVLKMSAYCKESNLWLDNTISLCEKKLMDYPPPKGIVWTT